MALNQLSLVTLQLQTALKYVFIHSKNQKDDKFCVADRRLTTINAQETHKDPGGQDNRYKPL